MIDFWYPLNLNMIRGQKCEGRADEPVEVGHNDRDGQSDAESPADAAEGGDQLARGRGRSYVAVARAGHGDDGPVQGLGQRVEHRVRLVLLQGVGQAGHDQHAHRDRHGEEQQFSAVSR